MEPWHPSPGEQQAFAVFRPRRGRGVAAAIAVLSVVLFGAIAVLLPGLDQGGDWRVGDRIFFVVIGVSVAVMLWRYASIRAVPTRETLTVRNLLTTRTIEWRSIVDLTFGGGDPWVSVELDDLDTVAVMAIQKADGAYGRAEASRLAALIQALGTSAKSPDVSGP